MRIGSRRSALALAQAQLVADMLGGAEIVPIVTSGDRAAAAGDKSRWVLELEQAIAAGQIDLAVHSAKDVPGELADGLCLAGAPPRAPAQDVLCGAHAIEALPAGARVGTSSVRRIAQLRAAREDLDVVALRGNVDTRLRMLAERENGLQAIVLARAGLQRLGRDQEGGCVLDPTRFVPAPGQGTLALETRAGDERTRAALAPIGDAATFSCLRAERALARALSATCDTPLGVHATPLAGGRILLRAWVGLSDGSQWIADEQSGEAAAPEALARTLAGRLEAVGARELLARAEVVGRDVSGPLSRAVDA
jgi:hydroxymethylbilane synthase